MNFFKSMNMRKKLIISICFSCSIVVITLFLSFFLSDDNLLVNFEKKNLPPSLEHVFGTDSLGRDMLSRTTKGLRFSLLAGIIGSFFGCLIATIMGICASTLGKKVDAFILWLIDTFIGVPHLIFMILVSIMLGGGARGIVIGVAVSHWTSLARIIRGEIYALKKADYIQIATNLGKSRLYITWRHIIPAIFPQLMIGFLLLFPHAIIHEASLTFLGFGLSVQYPAIGIILSEAVKHISLGNWWLAVFPGFALLLVVKSFDSIAEKCRILQNPTRAHE